MMAASNAAPVDVPCMSHVDPDEGVGLMLPESTLRYGAGGPEIPPYSLGTQEAEVREDGLMMPRQWTCYALRGRDYPSGPAQLCTLSDSREEHCEHAR